MRVLTATFFRRTFAPVFFFALTSALAASAQAQAPPGSRLSEEQRARQMSDRDLAERELALRSIGKVKKVDVNVAPIEVSLAKVKEDYEGIQVANNDILRMLAAGKGLDYKVIADSSSDIKKRAARLKSYIIALQLAKDDKKRRKNLDEIEPEGMKASLLSLDASIASVISSPIFTDFGKVVDTDNSNKARDDLDNIIELSERIKRSAELTIKSARASR